MKTALSLLLCFLIHNVAWCKEEAKVAVHIAGWVKKPGRYTLGNKITAKQIKEVCGGWDEPWAATNRVVLIRLARSSNPTMGLPAREKDLKLFFDFRKEGQVVELAPDDILFVPMKEVLGGE